MSIGPTLPTRAFELAISGLFTDWQAVASRLNVEGFEMVGDCFKSEKLQNQVDAACRKGRSAIPSP